MKKYFVFAALVLAAAVSCTRELATEEIVGPKKGYVQITLSANCDVDSKAVLDGKKVVWSVGEEVAVFPGGNGSAENYREKDETDADAYDKSRHYEAAGCGCYCQCSE